MLRRIKEEYFKQRLRINWLSCKDLNTTSYIQKITIGRNAFNTIHILIGLDGWEASSLADMGILVVAHLRSILGPSTMRRSHNSLLLILSLTICSCSASEAALLTKVPSLEEISKVNSIFALNPLHITSIIWIISSIIKMYHYASNIIHFPMKKTKITLNINFLVVSVILKLYQFD